MASAVRRCSLYSAHVELNEALATLGIATPAALACLSASNLRDRYLDELRRIHPDVNASESATRNTAALNLAYEVAATYHASGVHEIDSPAPENASESVIVRCVADDTIAVGAPHDETLLLLLEVCHNVGDVSFLDPSAGLVQVVVSFVDEPVCTLLFSLQGRAGTGETEIFLTLDSMEARDAPPVAAVTAMLTSEMTALAMRQ